MVNMDLASLKQPNQPPLQSQPPIQPQTQPFMNDTFSNSISTINPNLSLNNNNNIYSQPAFQPIEVIQSPRQRRPRKMSIFIINISFIYNIFNRFS